MNTVVDMRFIVGNPEFRVFEIDGATGKVQFGGPNGTTPLAQVEFIATTHPVIIRVSSQIADRSSLFQVDDEGLTTTKNLSIGAVGVGTPILGHLSATASLDFGATAANTCDDLTLTVTGAADGDTCIPAVPNALASVAGTIFSCFISAADTATVRRCNVTTSATADPASATVRADVWKH